MAGTPPRLEVVRGGADAEPAEATSPAPKESTRAPRWPWIALLVLLAVAVVGMLLEKSRADGLQQEVNSLTGVVAELESELSASEAAVSAHRAHLDDVRTFVSELQLLVEQDPETTAQ